MSSTLIRCSADLQLLQNAGYEIQVIKGNGVHLLVHNVPYVDVQRVVKRGSLVTPLVLNGDVTVNPIENHQAWFMGEHPCNIDGSEILGIKHSSGKTDFGDGIVVNHGFSGKPHGGSRYPNYFEKVRRYIDIITAPAAQIETGATAQTYKILHDVDADAVFHYADTASTRAGIGSLTHRLALEKVAIVGLGGTGSYILDMVAKTHVKEIHLFDGAPFYQHNAFRAPGAPAKEELVNTPKVDYFSGIYGKMRRNVIAHHVYVTDANIQELSGFNFVFVSVDKPSVRRLIFDFLTSHRIPFVDVGMDVQMAGTDGLIGQCRTTLGTPEKSDHLSQFVSFDDSPIDNVYASNIQVAELNALNAMLAVIKWKKHYGYYMDYSHEHQSVYTVPTNGLTKDATT